MKEIKISDEDVSLPYLESLEKTVNIRKNRRKIYKDEYLTDTPLFLMLTIENKLKRVKGHIENNTIINDVEMCEDSILDAVNYLLFLNCVLQKQTNISDENQTCVNCGMMKKDHTEEGYCRLQGEVSTKKFESKEVVELLKKESSAATAAILKYEDKDI